MKFTDTSLIPSNENLYAAGNEYCACGKQKLDYGSNYSVIRDPNSRKILLGWGGRSIGTTPSKAIADPFNFSTIATNLPSTPLFGSDSAKQTPPSMNANNSSNSSPFKFTARSISTTFAFDPSMPITATFNFGTSSTPSSPGFVFTASSSPSKPVFGTSIDGESVSSSTCCWKLAQTFVINWNIQSSTILRRQLLAKTDATGPLAKIVTYLNKMIEIWDKAAKECEIPKQLAIEQQLRKTVITTELQRFNLPNILFANTISLAQISAVITKTICQNRESLDFWGTDLLPMPENLTSVEINELFQTIITNKDINSLNFANFDLSADLEALMSLFTARTDITVLNLANTKLTNDALTKLRPVLLANHKLIEINLSGLDLAAELRGSLSAIQLRNRLSIDGDFLLKSMIIIPDDYRCPITTQIMVNPVITADGESYEQEEIEKWFAKGNNTSPKTNLALEHTKVMVNKALKNAIQAFLDKNAILKDSNEIYRSTKLMHDLVIAVGSKDLSTINRIISIDTRLLLQPLGEKSERLLFLACHSDMEILAAILAKLGEQIWVLPELEQDGGIGLFNTAYSNLGNQGACAIAKALGWTIAEWQQQLEKAILTGDFNLTELCLNTAAKLDIPNLQGELPLHQAVIAKQFAICEFLLKMNVAIDSLNKHGYTALHLAAQQGNLAIAKLLLEQGANGKATNTKQPKRPAILARDAGFADVAHEIESIRYRIKIKPFVEEIAQPLRQELARMQAQISLLQQSSPIPSMMPIGFPSVENESSQVISSSNEKFKIK